MLELLEKHLTPSNIIYFIISILFSFISTVYIYMCFGANVTDFLMPIFLTILVLAMIIITILVKIYNEKTSKVIKK